MMVAATISPRTYDYLVAPGAIAALLFTLGSLIFSAPPARVLLGAFGVSLAACSTGLVKTHATVSYGYGIAFVSHALRLWPLSGGGTGQKVLLAAAFLYGAKAIALQFVRDLSPSFTHKVTRLFRAFDRTDTKCPVTRSTAKLPLIFGTTILLVAYACSLYIATAKPAVPAVAVHAVARARLSIVAGAAALTAVALESLADWQKQHAKRLLGGESPTLATGLWRFSRHPNYFFDIVFHAAVAFAAASHASSAGALWLALAPPAAFAAVVLQATVSLEERQAKTYAANAAYMAWREETPRLLPRLPRPAATTSDVVLDDALTATADE